MHSVGASLSMCSVSWAAHARAHTLCIPWVLPHPCALIPVCPASSGLRTQGPMLRAFYASFLSLVLFVMCALCPGLCSAYNIAQCARLLCMHHCSARVRMRRVCLYRSCASSVFCLVASLAMPTGRCSLSGTTSCR